MGTLRRRNAVLDAVALKMLEEGKILTKGEWDLCKKVPVRSGVILNHFGSWGRLLSVLEGQKPHVFDELKPKPKPKFTPVYENKQAFSTEVDPLEKLRTLRKDDD